MNTERARQFGSILITGASSGIGAELARAYAADGVHLFLSGRNSDRLAEIAGACSAKGAVVDTALVDVTDAARMEAWIQGADDTAPLDLVIANAGVSGDTSGKDTARERERLIRAINIDGVQNTISAAVPRMRQRRKGQIALMSSLASFRGLPSAPAYAASKAWVRLYGEGLRGVLREDGVGVSVICPGFVHSRITAANRFRMPLIMDADRAARIIQRGLARNKARIAFPLLFYALLLFVTALPPGLTDRFLARLPRKE